MKMRQRDCRVSGTELLKDILFPARCPVCGDVITLENRLRYREAMSEVRNRHETGYGSMRRGNAVCMTEADTMQTLYSGVMCAECGRIPAYIAAPFCRKCGKQLNADTPEGLCADCRKNERAFTACRCVMTYDETAREMMAGLKYASMREYAFPMALMAADRLGSWLRGTGAEALIPVPVHSDRLHKRGYNQAELIADGIGLLTGIPVKKDILARNKKTHVQKELTAAERAENLQNAFSADGTVSGSVVVIVDDIYTTGATMEACAETLMKNGAGSIFGLCICAGEDKGA